MNLLLDENIDKQIVEHLRNDGHAIWYIGEMSPSISDNEVLKLANEKKAPIITSDKDFGELAFRLQLVSYGVILIRLPGLPPETKAKIVSHAISRHAAEMSGCFTVISRNRIRIRKFSSSQKNTR